MVRQACAAKGFRSLSKRNYILKKNFFDIAKREKLLPAYSYVRSSYKKKADTLKFGNFGQNKLIMSMVVKLIILAGSLWL